MKINFYFYALLCLLSFSYPAFSQVGCVSLEPYLDKDNKEIHDKKTCESQKTSEGGKSLNS